MIHTTLAEIEGLVMAAGLDLDALALIISERSMRTLRPRGAAARHRRRARRHVLCPRFQPPYRARRFRRTRAWHRRWAAGSGVHRRIGLLTGRGLRTRPAATTATARTRRRTDLGYGNARAASDAERVALNLITMMSGVATARAPGPTHSRNEYQGRDSRKTLPGLRMLQKYAVRVAGGINHRCHWLMPR